MPEPEFVDDDLILERRAEVAALTRPVRETVVAHPDVDAPVDWVLAERAQLKAELLAELRREITASPAPQGTVPFDLPTRQDPKPLSFKKHYRCEVYPELVIQKLDMTALDRGERPQANPLPGEEIRFRMTHLYTNDDDVVRQMDWAIANGLGTGGVYEDNGSGVYRCTMGCDYSTAVYAGYRAHMMARHQIEVGP